jgi:hypothetical protein
MNPIKFIDYMILEQIFQRIVNVSHMHPYDLCKWAYKFAIIASMANVVIHQKEWLNYLPLVLMWVFFSYNNKPTGIGKNGLNGMKVFPMAIFSRVFMLVLVIFLLISSHFNSAFFPNFFQMCAMFFGSCDAPPPPEKKKKMVFAYGNGL